MDNVKKPEEDYISSNEKDPAETSFLSEEQDLNIMVGKAAVQVEDLDKAFLAVLQIGDIKEIVKILRGKGVNI